MQDWHTETFKFDWRNRGWNLGLHSWLIRTSLGRALQYWRHHALGTDNFASTHYRHKDDYQDPADFHILSRLDFPGFTRLASVSPGFSWLRLKLPHYWFHLGAAAPWVHLSSKPAAGLRLLGWPSVPFDFTCGQALFPTDTGYRFPGLPPSFDRHAC